MATPAFLRYLPARLKPLGSPLVWGPLTAFCLLSIFIWEYHKNPNWFEREPVTSDLNPNSGLTPEEEAKLAEIDTLQVLLNGSKLPDGAPVVTSIIDPNVPGSDTATSETSPASNPSPFEVYLNQYKFPGAETTVGSPTSGTSASSAATNNRLSSGSSTRFGNRAANSSVSLPTTSALSQALDRQQADQSASNTQSDNNGTGGSSPSFSPSTTLRESSGQASTGQPTQSPGTIAVPFIRTTPQMSPPAGTTGYQVPASSSLPVFNMAPQRPSTSLIPSAGNRAVTSQPQFQNLGSQNAVPPTGSLYTAPTSIQPEQPGRNRRSR
ncbi:MAG: hypothetical protein HC800_13875 [Phormidesmis sp. RL_2_1]|nr:hypothetical protein [Phormidesmis sp. RL_2_1]